MFRPVRRARTSPRLSPFIDSPSARPRSRRPPAVALAALGVLALGTVLALALV